MTNAWQDKTSKLHDVCKWEGAEPGVDLGRHHRALKNGRRKFRRTRDDRCVVEKKIDHWKKTNLRSPESKAEGRFRFSS
ncbi:hypothetical protein RISK_004817 [Rhodopirellula islandica]|uniref:Uncharacterized protein n=1 Tax=Rhodopirellula islandica TaxID=595434 RepID=A0A0J1B9B1_RHOIS|nr:hypothetical protein RISK_004817 [Rhodopirellula islandica]